MKIRIYCKFHQDDIFYRPCRHSFCITMFVNLYELQIFIHHSAIALILS